MVNVVQHLEQRMDVRHQEMQQQLDDMQGMMLDVVETASQVSIGIFLSPSFDFPCP